MYRLNEKMEQILRKPLKAIDRPYSQMELGDIRQRYLDRLNIGNTMVYHEKTGYFYLAKAGGRKEAQIKTGEEINPASCSVTWKLRKTPDHLRDEVSDMIDAYHTLEAGGGPAMLVAHAWDRCVRFRLDACGGQKKHLLHFKIIIVLMILMQLSTNKTSHDE